jgi:drug/metabolite transporter (DMT)-like permease
MALLTKDPFMLRRAGWIFALAPAPTLYLAYASREDASGGAVFAVVLLAIVFASISVWSFRRAAGLEGQSMATEKQKNHKVVLAGLAVGWVAFGVVYGLMMDNTPAFLVALAAGLLTAGIAFYAWRREASE